MNALKRLVAMPDTTNGRVLLAATVCALAAIGTLALVADNTPDIAKAPLSLLDAPPAIPAEEVSTGTHWAQISEFRTLRDLGHEWVIATVSPDNRPGWDEMFDAAEETGIKLIVGLYPEPYKLKKGRWQIAPIGREFLRYAEARSELVKAVFVYNEPYWIDPFTHKGNLCGALSAAELRDLRTTIKGVWPEAKIYQDLGEPSAWEPGAYLTVWTDCIEDRFADQTGVADYVGVWRYRFKKGEEYDFRGHLAVMRKEVDFVREKMGAQPIVCAQSFQCDDCEGEASRFPTLEEFRDWQCALRGIGPAAVSFYPWRMSMYQQNIGDKPEYWPLTMSRACGL